MNKQEQIDALRFRIERIEQHLAEQHIPNNFGKCSEISNGCEPDYAHLLPEGYEFCQEQDAEKWVKVENNPYVFYQQDAIGSVVESIWQHDPWKQFYRPIRKIQYHVSVHESVTAEPDPYQVDWSKAPEWADSHAFDSYGFGIWHGSILKDLCYSVKFDLSNLTLPSGLDWKQSKRRRPI
jgi:hypothetical protein